MTLAQHVQAKRDVLSPTERRVADAVLADPELVAFGTVAQLAAAANTSGATVVRLVNRLDLSGFADLQALARAEVTGGARHAADRIREPGTGDPLTRAAAAAAEALATTFDSIDRATFERAVALLADRTRSVAVVVADDARGIGLQFATELGMLRPGVTNIDGSPVHVTRELAFLDPGDVLLTVDLPRYDTWLAEAVADAAEAGMEIIALTDSPLSALASPGAAVFSITGKPAGPFDSHIASLALLEALTAAVAERTRKHSTERLDRIEAAWSRSGVLHPDDR